MIMKVVSLIVEVEDNCFLDYFLLLIVECVGVGS